MGDIKVIPVEQLRNDLAVSLMEQRAYERLLPIASVVNRPKIEERVRVNGRIVAVIKAELERRETAVLIACSKKKRTGVMPASELYQGPLFVAQLAYARQVLGMEDDQIFVMSAKYSLVRLVNTLEPYDLMLGKMPAEERRVWGLLLVEELEGAQPDIRKVILLAGGMYRDAVTPFLRTRGIAIDTAVPTGLGYGQQVAWFKRQVANGQETDGG